MNELSWLIYLSGVAYGAQQSFIGIALLSGVIFCLAFIGYLVACVNEEDQMAALIKKGRRLSLTVTIVAGLAAMLIPDRQTILLIASSQFGEQVIKTPEAREIFTELKARIMRELHSDEAGK